MLKQDFTEKAVTISVIVKILWWVGSLVAIFVTASSLYYWIDGRVSRVENKQTTHEKEFNKLESKVESMEEVKSDLKQIKTDIERIKKNI